MAKNLIDYIRRPETLDAKALTQLKALVEKYPFYHAARIVYLRTLYQMHNPEFDGELRRTAVSVPSRKTLYNLFEGENARPENPIRGAQGQKPLVADAAASEKDTTAEFLSDFLDTLPQSQTMPVSNTADARQDYMEWLVQSDANENEESREDTPVMGQEKIDIFLDENEGHIDLEDIDQEDVQQPADAASSPSREMPESQLTEALAHIYIKQKQYGKARKIIQRIAERKGDRNRFLIDQLRFLDKLIINESNT